MFGKACWSRGLKEVGRELCGCQGSCARKGPEVRLGLVGWRQVCLECSEKHEAGRGVGTGSTVWVGKEFGFHPECHGKPLEGSA